ncbi:MAG TPA: sulfatase-like hydrolase/transferase, partial [Vicinamibacteria bacterium]|nr:sulfatase-like hydrolase/transferase [Vicinamibacteria bacterium]
EAVEKLSGHRPAGPLRGGKYSAFDGGTRVPMIVRWPGRVKPGASDALLGQVDFLASFAAFTGQSLGPQDGPDSLDSMAALLGASATGRDQLVEQAGALSLITQRWKLISPSQGRKVNPETNTELGNDPQPQLYDLTVDLGEKQNVAAGHPDVVKDLTARLERIRQEGRSRR